MVLVHSLFPDASVFTIQISELPWLLLISPSVLLVYPVSIYPPSVVIFRSWAYSEADGRHLPTDYLNEFKLKKGFRQLFQNTVYGFVNERRLQEARRLIYEGAKNMSVIAYELGYAHPQHFQRAFKKRFGVTPGSLLK